MLKRKTDAWELLRISSSLGLVIALPISGGTILGFLIDKSLNTKPAFTLIFLLGGIFLGFLGVNKKLKEINDTHQSTGRNSFSS